MDRFVIQGGKPLRGTIEVSGAKNVALPVMTAALLVEGVTRIRHVPNLMDTRTMGRLLEILGVKVAREGGDLVIDATRVTSTLAPYELVKTMRASIYVLGPLLARFGKARVSLPGGCAWGPRPVDLHISGMQKLGARVEIEHGFIVAEAARLKGAEIYLDVPSVGATANLMMAAVLAEGTTVIDNAAMEPDVEALGAFLAKRGARVAGAGTRRIEIRGVTKLAPGEDTIIPDRIEAGTFLIAGALAGEDLKVAKMQPGHTRAILKKLEEIGAKIEEGPDWVRVRSGGRPKPTHVVTDFYPGFPTDLQAQIMGALTVASGTSIVTDNIYLDRFTHVAELNRLGADIRLDKNVAVVRGVPSLSGAPVMATDIRASAALILAALVAGGTTTISRIYHIDRGYEAIEKKLSGVGAAMRREKE